MIALRDGELSKLYPIIALTFVWVNVLSVLFFREQMNAGRFAASSPSWRACPFSELPVLAVAAMRHPLALWDSCCWPRSSAPFGAGVSEARSRKAASWAPLHVISWQSFAGVPSTSFPASSSCRRSSRRIQRAVSDGVAWICLHSDLVAHVFQRAHHSAEVVAVGLIVFGICLIGAGAGVNSARTASPLGPSPETP